MAFSQQLGTSDEQNNDEQIRIINVFQLNAECNICGEEHETYDCPLVQGGQKVDDAKAPSRARLTLPGNLRIKTLKDGNFGIATREKVLKGTRFGPYEAPLEGIEPDSKFCLKVFRTDGTARYLNTADEENCNWMYFVGEARNAAEQNLMAYQVQEDIYYSATRDIRVHEEMRVWYAPHYGKKIGIVAALSNEDANGPSSTEKAEEKVLRKRKLKDHLLENPPLNKKRGRKKKVFHEYVVTSDLESNDILTEVLEEAGITAEETDYYPDDKNDDCTSNIEQREWQCSQCDEVYSNSVDFAYHLREHYNPRNLVDRRQRDAQPKLKNFGCQYCDAKFSTAKLLQRHRLKLHRRQMFMKKQQQQQQQEEVFQEISAGNIQGKTAEDITVANITEEELNEKLSKLSDKDAATILLEIESKREKSNDLETEPMNDDQLIDSATLSKVVAQTIMTDDGTTLLLTQEGAGDKLVEFFQTSIEETNIDGEMIPVVKMQEANVNQGKVGGEYICDICNKSFDKSVNLFRHIMKHTGEFVCNKCQKVFARKENLNKHLCIGSNTKKYIQKTDEQQNKCSCSFCKKCFGSKHLLKRHVTKHTGDVTCIECGKSYSSSEELKDHVCTKKRDGDAYSCEICHKTFSKLKYLDKHIPVHTGAHTCPICSKWLRSNDSLMNHMRICGQTKELDSNGLASCPHCKREFSDLKAFRRHIYEHTHLFSCHNCGARFRNKVSLSVHVCEAQHDVACDECGSMFENIAMLNQHKQSHGEPAIICKKCGETFVDKDDLGKHTCKPKMTNKGRKPRKPPNLQPLVCDQCNAQFSSTSSLNVHKRLHGDKEYACETCGKRFHRKDLMIDHRAVHAAPSVPCPVCDRMFKTKKSLDVHLLIHDGVKRYSCGTCGKEFYQKGNLIKHEEVHNPDRKYCCEHCFKSFSTKEYLAIHVLEHTRGRIYECDICLKKFVKDHQLKTHQRVFHSEMAYICKFCDLSVKLKHSLKRHLQKKHSDKKHLWAETSQLDDMLERQPDNVTTVGTVEGTQVELSDLTAEDASQLPAELGAEVLLAVTGIGSKALQEALAMGSARIQQGSEPNTIEISLPIENSVQDTFLTEDVESGEELQTHIIELPVDAQELGSSDVIDLNSEDSELHACITVDSATIQDNGTQISVMEADENQQDNSLEEETIVLENGAVLQRGIDDDGADVLFYVLTTDDPNADK